MKKLYGVLGGGSWGTALVKILLEKNESINWYVRNEENLEHIKKFKRNPNYLRSLVLDTEKIKLSDSIEKVVKNSDIIILAIPSPFLDSELKKIKSSLSSKTIFSALKGVVPESHLIVSEHLNKVYNLPLSKIGIITGPCHAEEVALEKLSYLTVACKNQAIGESMRESLDTKFIKAKLSKDSVGVEYAAMLKNVYALITGISHGLGYGDNFQSVLISNSVREMKEFIKTIYKFKRDINDTEYLGDLLVTSYSTFSRNRTLGNMLGKGYSLKAAISEMSMISEGYYATKNAYEIGIENKIEFDIINTAYDILYRNLSPKKCMKILADKLN
ncbi:NAD(P)-binding domain-containing protein [Flavobacteriaceae bacterium]|jgi:glycerol-3-phosphate dehydrogenase (NAD(P)+)|nr:NAD(P)-binding domain-containing protein [Flavobacteriaceae bacterium]|tara:strand:+ start:18226 stop:19215 length:990 start_codon:yes stop_codon:yes gene_type:complete